MRLALTVEYDGTDYHGFQYQTNAPSIQEQLEKAVTSLTGERLRIRGAGRTDAGVHARGQVVAFDTDSTHSPETFVRALNSYLPDDIAVRAAHCVHETFDPRRDALSRRYRYTIVNSATPSPLTRSTACRIGEALDVDKMRKAAELFLGEHDFARFSGPLEDKGASTTRRVCDVLVSQEGEIVSIDVEGSAFLPHQVRRMTGALVDVGKGDLSLDELKSMVDGGPSGAIAHTLPPQGLCLMEVTYQDFPPKVGVLNGDKQ